MPDNQQKQLFTELTPEEGAAVAGGATLELLLINPSFSGSTNPLIMVGTNVVHKESDLRWDPNEAYGKALNKKFEFTGNTTLSLWNQDDGSNNDDLLASVNLTETRDFGVLDGGGVSITYRVLA